MAWENLDSVHRASTGAVAPASWGDQVNDDVNYLYGDTAAISPSLENGWLVAATASPRYRRHGTTVSLDGEISSGTNAAVAFVLPAGYQPPASRYFSCVEGGGTFAYVAIHPDGSVLPTMSVATSNGVYLDGISFEVI